MTKPETVLPKCGGRGYCNRMPFCGCGGPDPLSERDATKTAEQQGVFRKFNVTRVDGSDQPGGKHHGCEYFVLDVDHDKHAKAALAAYADSVEATHPALAADMRERYGLAKLAEKAEPVAYRNWHPNGRVYYIGDPPSRFRSDTGEPDEYFGGKSEPLYTHPPTGTALLEAALEDLKAHNVLMCQGGGSFDPECAQEKLNAAAEKIRAAIESHKGKT